MHLPGIPNLYSNQTGTLHFNATYGWSCKIATFCNSQLGHSQWNIQNVYSPGDIILLIFQSCIITYGSKAYREEDNTRVYNRGLKIYWTHFVYLVG